MLRFGAQKSSCDDPSREMATALLFPNGKKNFKISLLYQFGGKN